ncbi:MAG: hypothetical protein HY985_11185 [Magnetospirillum sp.]|nr:hypothetical protein [Magnetospirillum sp.]
MDVRALLGTAAALLVAVPAAAQWNNEAFSFRGSSGGVGMSLAYRQAILADELFGRRPDARVRGADGRLVEVIRRNRQAFLATPDPDLLPFNAPGPAATRWVAAPVPARPPVDAWIGQLAELQALR